jgi:hypothetical protein
VSLMIRNDDLARCRINAQVTRMDWHISMIGRRTGRLAESLHLGRLFSLKSLGVTLLPHEIQSVEWRVLPQPLGLVELDTVIGERRQFRMVPNQRSGIDRESEERTKERQRLHQQVVDQLRQNGRMTR